MLIHHLGHLLCVCSSALISGPVWFFHPFRREPGLDWFYIFHNSTENWTRPHRTSPLWLWAVTGLVLTIPELTSVLTSHQPVIYLLLVYNCYSKSKRKRKKKKKKQHNPPHEAWSCPALIIIASTCDPPYEQLLARLGWVWHCCCPLVPTPQAGARSSGVQMPFCIFHQL